MLVGVGGSGKQSLTRFAAHISGCKVFQIELSRVYGTAEFRADLVKLYRTAGVQNEPVVFLFSDNQILQESFVEDINNMLNSGGQARPGLSYLMLQLNRSLRTGYNRNGWRQECSKVYVS